jgi:predicted Zn-dependent peptidase
MSVEITQAAIRPHVITDAMPHLETAALGVWAGVAAATKSPTSTASRISSNTWRSRATRRSSREIVEEIEAVGGDLNAGTSTETTAYYARVMKADVRWRSTCCPTSSPIPFRSGRTGREKGVIVQEIGAAQDTPTTSCSSISTSSAIRTSRWAARCSAPRNAEEFDRDMLRGYLTTHYAGRTW